MLRIRRHATRMACTPSGAFAAHPGVRRADRVGLLGEVGQHDIACAGVLAASGRGGAGGIGLRVRGRASSHPSAGARRPEQRLLDRSSTSAVPCSVSSTSISSHRVTLVGAARSGR